MRKLILATSVILMGFPSYGQTNHEIFKLSDYVLARTDSSSRGLEKKLYIYKYDTARRMRVYYFYDGTVLARSFWYKGKLEGNLEIFSAKGQPIAIDSFHNGVKVSSRSIIPIDTSTKFFSNGKLRPLKAGDIDSLLKK